MTTCAAAARHTLAALEAYPAEPAAATCCPGSLFCLQEARLLASLRHPNIVQFMGLCTEPACIITELCAKGSLTDVIRSAKAAPANLPWQRRLDIVRDGVGLGLLAGWVPASGSATAAGATAGRSCAGGQ